MQAKLMCAAAALFGFAGVSLATPIPYIGVQFVAPGGGQYNGPATTALSASQSAGVYPQSNYNITNLSTDATGGSVSNQALLDASGNATTVTLSAQWNDVWGAGTDGSTPNGALLQGEFKSGGSSTATLTLNNVPAGNYSLVAYTEDDGGGISANYTLGGTTYYIVDQATTGTPAFVQATNASPTGTRDTGNYVEFDNISVPTGGGSLALSVTGVSGNNIDAAINGIQLLSVAPEPASVGLLSFAALGLLSRRRHRTRR